MTPQKHQGRAVVIGASMAGLCAARVLAERFDSVVIVERDDLENTTDGRRGVPQSRHAHALLKSGCLQLEDWFPGIMQELIDGGAESVDPGRDFHWFQGGGPKIAYEAGGGWPVASRPRLEETVRNRVEKLDNVELRTKVHVEGLRTSDDKQRVTGVELEGGDTLDAALVLDCSGRSGLSLKWVEELGFAPPAVVEVGMNMRYTTRTYKKNPAWDPGWKLAIVIGAPPEARLGVCFPMEGDRWMVTLAGYHGEHAPDDDAGFLAYARSLDSPVIAEAIENNEPLTDYTSHRMAANQRRLVEKMRTVPAGWALLGDAVASFNPVYGQGMSSAALQAVAMGGALDGYGSIDAEMTRRIHKAAAKAVTNPWMLSTGGDFAHPKTTGKKPPGTNLINRYLRRVVVADQRDVEVAKAFDTVGNLMAPPTSIMKPAMMLRVLRNSRGKTA